MSHLILAVAITAMIYLYRRKTEQDDSKYHMVLRQYASSYNYIGRHIDLIDAQSWSVAGVCPIARKSDGRILIGLQESKAGYHVAFCFRTYDSQGPWTELRKEFGIDAKVVPSSVIWLAKYGAAVYLIQNRDPNPKPDKWVYLTDMCDGVYQTDSMTKSMVKYFAEKLNLEKPRLSSTEQ